MAKWFYKVDLVVKDKETAGQDLARQLRQHLPMLLDPDDSLYEPDLLEAIEELDLANDIEDVDDALEMLYDWGDKTVFHPITNKKIGKMCWIWINEEDFYDK